MKTNKKEILLIVSSFLVGGICMLILVRFTPLVEDIIGSKNGYVITKNDTQLYEKSSLAPSVEKVYDSVVLIQGYKDDDLVSNGTGFVYKIDEKYGYILTNEHIINGNKTVVIYTSEKEEEAEILGKDEYLDLAVLRVNKKNVKTVVDIGSSEDMKLGDVVFTIGSPIGYEYRGSVTSGILSGKDRMVSTSVKNSTNADWVMRVLQIDASINPGNSGGPLLNVNGEVIGICSLKLVDDNIEGMGFAIPIEYAMSHVESLEKGKKIKWPVLGIGIANLNETNKILKNGLNVNTKVKEGAVVLNIKDGSGAADSSLKPGDIIIEANNHKIKDTAHLRYELYQHQAGDTIEIKYLRDEKEHTTKIKLN